MTIKLALSYYCQSKLLIANTQIKYTDGHFDAYGGRGGNQKSKSNFVETGAFWQIQ